MADKTKEEIEKEEEDEAGKDSYVIGEDAQKRRNAAIARKKRKLEFSVNDAENRQEWDDMVTNNSREGGAEPTSRKRRMERLYDNPRSVTK